MSFAADLKDFASNFRDTYKTFHVSGKDELDSERAKYLRQERDLEARAAARGDVGAAEAGQGGMSSRLPSMVTPGAIGDYSRAIQGVESSGNPRAKGPEITSGAYKGDRA